MFSALRNSEIGASMIELQVAMVLMSGTVLGLGAAVHRSTETVQQLTTRNRTEVAIAEDGGRVIVSSLVRTSDAELPADVQVLAFALTEDGWKTLVQADDGDPFDIPDGWVPVDDVVDEKTEKERKKEEKRRLREEEKRRKKEERQRKKEERRRKREERKRAKQNRSGGR